MTEDDTVYLSLTLRIGDLRLDISKALSGVQFRDCPIASVEGRVLDMLIQIIPRAVTAFDARKRSRV